jgi:predicted lysophospholipase L1 biosynthesis ABC-type transport system permease subunit
MQQRIKTALLSILAFVLLAGLLSSVGMATKVWWTYRHGYHFCSTPSSWLLTLSFVAIVCFLCLVGTLRLLVKKQNAAPLDVLKKHRV